MTYPTGTETLGQIPFAAQLFDGGGAVFNVMNPTYGAKGDGSTDDTAAIQAALDAAPAGGVIVFPPATYSVGKLDVATSVTIMAYGATFSGSDAAIFCITADIDHFHVFGAAFTFASTTGTTGKEAIVNASTASSATVSDFGENLTSYSSYLTVNDIGKCVIRDCEFGFCKVTISGTATDPWVLNNVWDNQSVAAAPYYLLVADVPRARVTGNSFVVTPPTGDNKDIAKISNVVNGGGFSATDVHFCHNHLESRNSACTCAQLDIYNGGRRLLVDGNTFINVQLHHKAWGASDGGVDFHSNRVTNNSWVRESGYTLTANSVESCIYLINSRVTISGNVVRDEASASASLTFLKMDETSGADFDALATIHCTAITVSHNIFDCTDGNNTGIFARYTNTDSGDPAGYLTFIGNVMVNGEGWFRTAGGSTSPSYTSWVGNVWHSPNATEVLQIGVPANISGNTWPAVVERGIRVYSPSTLSAGDNLAVNFFDVETVRVTPNASNSTICGIGVANNNKRRKHTIINVGSSGDLVLGHQDTAETTATYRLISPTGADVTLGSSDVATVEYDETVSRWRILSVLT